ncbi:MAG: NUDIX pyrophosphatase [Candidatus Bipolaricaulia bacterium]
MPPGIDRDTVSVYPFRITSEGPEYLALHRSPGLELEGTWQAVHGKIEPGETAVQAAWRETVEETGVRPVELWMIEYVELFYDERTDQIRMVPCFAAQLDEQSEVRISGEHDDHRWLPLERISSTLIWPNQQAAIEILHRQLARPLAEGREVNPYLKLAPRLYEPSER